MLHHSFEASVDEIVDHMVADVEQHFSQKGLSFDLSKMPVNIRETLTEMVKCAYFYGAETFPLEAAA